MVQKRHTQQRTAIETAFRQSQRPLSVSEVLEFARKQIGSMDPATIYRNLGRMVAEGHLKCVKLPSKGILYELADRAHHHHFHCQRCDRAFELPGCGLRTDQQAPSGFQVEGHDVFLYGICPDCGESA